MQKSLVYKIPKLITGEGINALDVEYILSRLADMSETERSREIVFARAALVGLNMYQNVVEVYRVLGDVYRAYAGKPILYLSMPGDENHCYLTLPMGYRQKGKELRPMIKGEDLVASGRIQLLSPEETEKLFERIRNFYEHESEELSYYSNSASWTGVPLPENFVPDETVDNAKISPRWAIGKMGLLPLYAAAGKATGNQPPPQSIVPGPSGLLASGKDIQAAANAPEYTGPQGQFMPKAVFVAAAGEAQDKIGSYIKRRDARGEAVRIYLAAARERLLKQNSKTEIGLSAYSDYDPVTLEVTIGLIKNGRPVRGQEPDLTGFLDKGHDGIGKWYLLPNPETARDINDLLQAIPEKLQMSFEEYFGFDGVSAARYGENFLLICAHDMPDRNIQKIAAMTGTVKLSRLAFHWLVANAWDFDDKVLPPPIPISLKQEIENAGIAPAEQAMDMSFIR